MPRLQVQPRGLFPDISFGREPSNSTGGTFTHVAAGFPGAHPENSLSFLFRCFFFLGLRFGGGCWRGFGFCEVASHKFEFLHGKFFWQPASGMQCFGKDCYRELTESNERV